MVDTLSIDGKRQRADLSQGRNQSTSLLSQRFRRRRRRLRLGRGREVVYDDDNLTDLMLRAGIRTTRLWNLRHPKRIQNKQRG